MGLASRAGTFLGLQLRQRKWRVGVPLLEPLYLVLRGEKQELQTGSERCYSLLLAMGFLLQGRWELGLAVSPALGMQVLLFACPRES